MGFNSGFKGLMRAYVEVQLASLGKENVSFSLKMEATALSSMDIKWHICYGVLKFYTGILLL